MILTNGSRCLFLALGLFVVLGKTLAQECTSSGESFESPLVDANGDLDSNALLFDMTARQRMEITSLDIRFEETLRDQDYLVSVYSKSGTYMGFESDSTAWTAAFFGRLSVPRQQSNVIALPEAAFRSVLVEGDSQHAFYIFLRSTRDTPILSSSGSAVGDVASSDDNLIIFHGQTAAPNFEASSAAAAPAIWLGRLHYNICDEDNNELDSSTSPSLSFTSTPSQSPTVEGSAVKTQAPSAAATNLPTASLRPTMKESSSPTQTPSSGLSSVLASSQLPTGEDIDSSSPTQEPSSSPSQSSTSEDSSTPSWAPSSDLSNVPTAPPVSYPPTEDDQCPSILQNLRTESMMLARTDTQVVTISENKRELLTGGQCYLSEGTRADGCYVASYKEECVFDGYRLETSDRRSTYVIQEDRVIFCNRTRHEKEWYVQEVWVDRYVYVLFLSISYY